MNVPETLKKSAIVLADDLSPGLAANACVLLGLAFGSHIPERLERPLRDADGKAHPGLHSLPVAVLTTDRETLSERVMQARGEHEAGRIAFFDLTDAAQTSQTYDLYAERLLEQATDAPAYRALFISGSRKAVDRLTKGLSLYGATTDPETLA